MLVQLFELILFLVSKGDSYFKKDGFNINTMRLEDGKWSRGECE